MEADCSFVADCCTSSLSTRIIMNRLARFAVVSFRPRAFSTLVAAPRVVSGFAKFQHPAIKIATRAFGATSDEEVGLYSPESLLF